jgi:hypothetical protein
MIDGVHALIDAEKALWTWDSIEKKNTNFW